MISLKKSLFAVFVASFIAFVMGTTFRKDRSATPEVKSLSDQTIHPSATVTPSPFITSNITLSVRESAQVSRVIDGDTIELYEGKRVRYIGIDTPETSDPRRGVQCYGREAYEKNRELVVGKIVELEKDVSDTDKYGRLLRYVYINKVMVNELLVREGYANSSSYPPDVKYQDRFIEAQRLSREDGKGLWGSACSVTPTKSISGSSSGISSSVTDNIGYTCDCTKSCKDISTCEEAQFQLKNCGCSARDGDGDGIACDGTPLSCQN